MSSNGAVVFAFALRWVIRRWHNRRADQE